MVVLVNGEFESETPESLSNGARPTGHCMKKHDPGLASENTNVSFGEAVLPVSANGGERLTLLLNFDIAFEGGRVIDAIVASVVTNVDVFGACERFEVMFGLDSLITRGGLLVATVNELGNAVDKESGTFVTTLGGGAGVEGDQAADWRNHLIGGDKFTGRCGRKGVSDMALMRFALGTAKLTVLAKGEWATSNLGRKIIFAITGPFLKEAHVDVSGATMKLK